MTTIDVVATHDTLTLTKLYHVDDIDYSKRAAAGDFEKVVESDGSWHVVDTSDEGNQFTVLPPAKLEPPFMKGDYHVSRFTERGSAGSAFKRITLELTRTKERPHETIDLYTGVTANEAGLQLPGSAGFTTDKVQSIDNENDEEFTAQFLLTPEQTEVVMRFATKLDAVTTETVPDGDDIVRDNSDVGMSCTFVVGSGIANRFDGSTSQSVVITDWRVSMAQPLQYNVTLSMHKK